MISSETPYKLAEIIRATWPGIFLSPEINNHTDNNSNVQIQNFTDNKGN